MRSSISHAEAEPYLDSLCLLEAIYDERLRQCQFEARLHDKELAK